MPYSLRLSWRHIRFMGLSIFFFFLFFLFKLSFNVRHFGFESNRLKKKTLTAIFDYPAGSQNKNKILTFYFILSLDKGLSQKLADRKRQTKSMDKEVLSIKMTFASENCFFISPYQLNLLQLFHLKKNGLQEELFAHLRTDERH